MQLFSHNLETLRVWFKLSQSEMAEKFGVTQTSYRRWENGTEPPLETIVQIADFFKIKIDDLLKKDLSAGSVHYYPVVDDLPAPRAALLQEPGHRSGKKEREAPPVSVEDWAALAARLLYLEGEVAKLRADIKALLEK